MLIIVQLFIRDPSATAHQALVSTQKIITIRGSQTQSITWVAMLLATLLMDIIELLSVYLLTIIKELYYG